MAKYAMLFSVAAADEWADFKQQFNKVYNGDSEDAKRKGIFESNKAMWGEHESGAILGATQFSDLTLEEFQALPIRGYAASMKTDLPFLGEHEGQGEAVGAIDWVSKGAVTAVKDQGQCGSCWAFSTTGGMEGAWQIASGSLTSMSEQQLVDCSTQNSGCNGGSMELAFNFAGTVNVATESSDPYTARDGTCKTSFTTAIPQGGVTGYKSVGQSSNDLKSALQTGPVSVAIEADQMAFQLYSGGVLKSGCGTNLDHGVLAVGYTADAFKVKNSWGSSWGESGYLQISSDGNTCGIHSDASYPTVSASVAV
jgi:C1A family cysteine protease